MSQLFSLYHDLTVSENIEFAARLREVIQILTICLILTVLAVVREREHSHGAGVRPPDLDSVQDAAGAFVLLILVLLPAVMLSGFVSASESMPKIFQWMSIVNPIRYFLEIVRDVFLKGIGVSQLWPRYLILPFMATAIMFTATKRFRRAIA